jgi:hypothetical protein
LVIPTIVMGGKIDNDAKVSEQLELIETILSFGFQQAPPEWKRLKDGLERIDNDNGSRLTMTIEVESLPWDFFYDQVSDPDAEVLLEKLETLVEGRQIAITIGMLEDYLVVAFSESYEDVDALAEPESKLIDTEEMKLVRDHATDKVIGINYASDAMNGVNFKVNLENYFSKNFGLLVSQAQTQLDNMIEYADDDEAAKYEAILEILDQVPADLEWLDDTIRQHVPEFKGQTGVVVAHDDGFEMWSHSRTENVVWDDQSKLTVLEQLGGTPIGFMAARRQYHPEYFDSARLIVQKLRSYLEQAAIDPIMDGEGLRKAEVILNDIYPLIAKIADAIETDLIPSTKDGQVAVVLSEPKIKANQWFADMPPSETELPFPELAAVIGVSDAELLVGGLKKVFDACDELVDAARKLDPNMIPDDYTVPRPMSKDGVHGKTYYVPIPDDCPVPETMAPQAVFGKSFAYINFSEPQLEAIAKPTKLDVVTDFLKSDEDLGAAVYLNLGKLFSEYKPWANFGVEQIGQDEIDPPRPDMDPITKADILEVYEAFTKIGELISVETGTESGTVAHARYFK